MRYEVTWMEYQYNWTEEIEEQCFTTEQFDTLEKAMELYGSKKVDLDTEHIKISVILDEYTRG